MNPDAIASAYSRASTSTPFRSGRLTPPGITTRLRVNRMVSVPAFSHCGTASGESCPPTAPMPLMSMPSCVSSDHTRSGSSPIRMTERDNASFADSAVLPAAVESTRG